MKFVQFCGSLSLFAFLALPMSAQEVVAMKVAAPELKGIDDWVNSNPFTLKDQKGKVVILHFWTFGCINCIHNYPAYAAWHKDFSEKGVTVLGVHTPEFDGEKVVDKIKAKVKDNKIEYPIAIDNGRKTWQAWENQFWPAVYLIDKRGDVRFRWYGELN